MLTPPAPAERYLSQARLDTTTAIFVVKRRSVSIALAARELDLAPIAGLPADRHVVILEMFRVSEGQLDVGGMGQDRWLAANGSMLGAAAGSMIGGGVGAAYGAWAGATMGGYMGLWYGPAAWAWGTAAGFMAGGSIGGAAGGIKGAGRGASVGGGAGNRAARGISDTLGKYGEVMITIPNVIFRARPRAPHLFVAGMYTDSALAEWGDRRLGFGFGKQIASLATHPFRAFVVRGGPRPVLSAAFAPVGEQEWVPAAAAPLPARVREWWAQPLLGRVRGDELVSSRLDRTLDAPSVTCAFPARSRISIARGFAPGLPAGTHRLPPASSAFPSGVFHVRGLLSRVSYPHPIRDPRPAPGVA